MESPYIRIRGAREHNLKNIDVVLPRNRLIVITGLSGSGKSSLAFDTLYAEGQRRYVESLSAYARQFLGLMEKPDVDVIEGLSPAISIEQKSGVRNPRSTVATVTEIYDYLRLLYARIGHPHCPKCGRPISRQSAEEIVDTILSRPKGAKLQLYSPLIRGRKGTYQELFSQIQKDGFVRVRVDKTIRSLDEKIELDKNKKHNIDVVVDRIVLKDGTRSRLTESVETALRLSSGLVTVAEEDKEEATYSEKYACTVCGISLSEIAPRLFSFNSPFGACPTCTGLGFKMEIDPQRLIPNPHLSLEEGAIASMSGLYEGWLYQQLEQVAEHFGFRLDVPFRRLKPEHQRIILYGSGRETVQFRYESADGDTKYEHSGNWEGVLVNLQRRYRQTNSEGVREWIEGFMGNVPCPDCEGKRLRPEALAVKIAERNIAEVTSLSIREAEKFFRELAISPREQTIAKQVLKEIQERLHFLINVGLDYLTLDRSAGSLAGGEAQRIHLATQIGSQLTGVLYILDEPSIGLHQRDNARLIRTLSALRDIGNTVIVVEHDREMIQSADFVVDLGPGAGVEGGYLVVAGAPPEIAACAESITGKFLSGKETIKIPKTRRPGNGKLLQLLGARGNNLHNVSLEIPLGTFTVITGVSGSGKSTLINETLYRALARRFYDAADSPLAFSSMKGVEAIDKVVSVDQSPIGRTPRSNPATYTGLFTPIRDLFAQLPEAKIRGYMPGRFSFNVKGGRCEHCQGGGIIKIEMHFLPDVYVPCEVCKGKRYNRETLEVRFRGKSIAEVLDMTVAEALKFFENIPTIRRKLQTLYDVGLGYICLGQQATTLSGGEAQRVKLSAELGRVATGQTLYILDEPTTGLHFADIRMLLNVLSTLVDRGNTVVVIEHNLDVIKCADWVIDLGPEGGDEGGRIIATGAPEQITKVPLSYTGKYLKKVLAGLKGGNSGRGSGSTARTKKPSHAVSTTRNSQ
jgi:excinuclease ABC subunit A